MKGIQVKTNWKTINEHKQIFDTSCIASAIEMVLKLNKKVKTDYYELQNKFENKNRTLSFGNFDRKILFGMKFKILFNIKREDDFPIDKLFDKIDEELENKHYVIISLESKAGWHMWVIYDKSNEEYYAFSKENEKTIYESEVKKIVKKMKGTDILVYEFV